MCRGRLSAALALALLASFACRRQETGLPRPGAPEQRITVITRPIVTPPAEDPAREAAAEEQLVTLNAVDAPVRALIAAIAQQAGLDVVISPEVTGVVTVNLDRVPAREALGTVLRAAGLGFVGVQTMQVAWNPTVVFYDLPVHVDSLSAEAIMRRFGVSRELAEFMVRSRTPAP